MLSKSSGKSSRICHFRRVYGGTFVIGSVSIFPRTKFGLLPVELAQPGEILQTVFSFPVLPFRLEVRVASDPGPLTAVDGDDQSDGAGSCGHNLQDAFEHVAHAIIIGVAVVRYRCDLVEAIDYDAHLVRRMASFQKPFYGI